MTDNYTDNGYTDRAEYLDRAFGVSVVGVIIGHVVTFS